MTVGDRIKTISQDWFLTEPLMFAVLCTHAMKRNDNMGCDMRCGKGLIEYNPDRLEHFDDNQLALRLNDSMPSARGAQTIFVSASATDSTLPAAGSARPAWGA